MDLLKQLQHWHRMHCDSDWEHSYGITIETLDNPGWKVSIDLSDTLLENANFEPVQIGDSESKNDSWIFCYKSQSCFIGMGGCYDLEKILKIFLEWSETCTDTTNWDMTVNLLIRACKTCNQIETMRQIYRKIDTVPNEHERKKELLDLFYSKWNALTDDSSNSP